jgi:hypothetical protein
VKAEEKRKWVIIIEKIKKSSGEDRREEGWGKRKRKEGLDVLGFELDRV